MRQIWIWIKDNAGPMTVTVAILGGFAGIMQFSVVRPVHQCFDAQDRCIEDLATDTSEFHGCSQLIVYHFMYYREDVMQLVKSVLDDALGPVDIRAITKHGSTP